MHVREQFVGRVMGSHTTEATKARNLKLHEQTLPIMADLITCLAYLSNASCVQCTMYKSM